MTRVRRMVRPRMLGPPTGIVRARWTSYANWRFPIINTQQWASQIGAGAPVAPEPTVLEESLETLTEGLAGQAGFEQLKAWRELWKAFQIVGWQYEITYGGGVPYPTIYWRQIGFERTDSLVSVFTPTEWLQRGYRKFTFREDKPTVTITVFRPATRINLTGISAVAGEDGFILRRSPWLAMAQPAAGGPPFPGDSREALKHTGISIYLQSTLNTTGATVNYDFRVTRKAMLRFRSRR